METERIRQLFKSFDTSPVYLWGKPGDGKLHLLEKIAKEEGAEFVNLQAAGPLELLAGGVKKLFPLLPSTEAKGIIVIDLDIFKRKINYKEIFLPLISLILGRRSRNYNLPTGWRIIIVWNYSLERFFTEFLQCPLIPSPIQEIKVD